MRALALLVFLLATAACLAKHPQELPENASWTYLLFALTIGDYYVTHHAWPTTRQQLEAHGQVMVGRERDAQQMKKDMKKLWKRFIRVELKQQGRDLFVSAHFRADEGEFDYDALYHPGSSGEAIIQAITPK